MDLRFTESSSEVDLREAILECGRICYERGLVTSNDGNISVRVGNEHVLITPSGLCKGRMASDDLLLMDLEGNVLSRKDGTKPSSETPMHLEVYKQRPDVRAVLHAHPVFATALTVSDTPFPVDVLPEVLLTLGEVPTTRYATPSSHDDADAIRDLIRDHDALLLRQHGSLTVGNDLDAALTALERIEHVAEVFWRAQLLGKVKRIPEGEVEKLLKVRERFRSGM
jgi:L-fuculose-phosphate aldolase